MPRNRPVNFGKISIILTMTAALACTKSPPKAVGPIDAATYNKQGSDGTYSLTIVLPKTAATGLSLAGGNESTVSYTSFNSDGNETATGDAQVSTDADGTPTAQLSVDPDSIYAIETRDFGIVIPQTGDAPGANLQVPMTLAGKNVVDAFKSLPKESRPFLNPAAAEVLLPAGTKYDNSTMKDMMLALAEQTKSMPLEKRLELNLERAKVVIDYKDIVKNSGDLEVAFVSATASAGKAFLASNPDLSTNLILKLLQRPAEALTANSNLIMTLPSTTKSQVLSQALARQVVSAIVENNDGKPFSTTDLKRVTPTLENVQAGYVAAKSYSDAFAEKFIQSVRSASFADDGKSKHFDPEKFTGTVSEALDRVSSLPDMQAFFGNKERLESNTPGCVEWREKCSGETHPDPQKVASDLQNAAHDLIGLLTNLSDTDQAILSCSSGLTQQAIGSATECANGGCVDGTGILNQGAKAACAINECLENFMEHNPYVEAMSVTCEIGDKLGEAIECNGFPGLGGGLASLCDTEIKNRKPPELKPCPYSPSVPACSSDGRPLSEGDIETACLNQVDGYNSDQDFALFQGACLARCTSLTGEAAKNCEPTPPPPSSFCAVGDVVYGGFTYSNLTAAQCEEIGLYSCYGNEPNSPCRCGHPQSAPSCTEYYQMTVENSYPGVVLPIPQELCPDALLEAAKQINNPTDCAGLSASNPGFNIRWIQK